MSGRGGKLVVAGLVTCALHACTEVAPRARAQRIGVQSQLIGGPKAIGRIGDYLLENDQIRLIISDKGQGRVNTPYGGSLVDADLVRVGPEAGNDQLAEVLPGYLFSVINPTEVEVTANGADGGAAEVTVRGTGEDLLQTVGLLNAALLYAPSLAFEQRYRLLPGKRHVEIITTVTNKTAGVHLLPYVEPAKLAEAGVVIPGVENLRFSVPMGQFLLFGGEQRLFAPGTAGFNVRFAIEDSYAVGEGFPAFPGIVADFVATKGNGVSYGLLAADEPSNYPAAFRDLYQPNFAVNAQSLVLPFTYAGVAAAYTANPPPSLAAGQAFTFRSYFMVGDGDVASISEQVLDLKAKLVGHVGGVVVDETTSQPVANASVVISDDQDQYVTQVSASETGAFELSLEPGDYRYVVVTADREVSARRTFTVGRTRSHLRIELPPPATLGLTVLDEQGRRAPVKLTLVGDFALADRGKDPRTFLFSHALAERERPTAADGSTAFVENQWTAPDGQFLVTAKPGKYQAVITRGPEFEVLRVPVELKSGVATSHVLRIKREFDTPGWVAADFHLHAAPSTDADLSLDERVVSCAAEGLEVVAATDHNMVTDYAPYIARNRLEEWMVSLPGVELTTFEAGHFNAYPLRVDAGSTKGGEFEWARKQPQVIFDQLRTTLALPDVAPILQVNHPRQLVLGYFAQFFLDAETGEPYVPTGVIGVFAPYGDEFKSDKFSYDFDALELMTGKRSQDIRTMVAPNPLPPGPFPDPQPVPGEVVRSPDGRPAFPGVVDTWFTLLDRGHRATGVGTSDSHGTLGEEPGYARTMVYVGADRDTPGAFASRDIVEAIRAHRTIATNGPMVEMTIGSGQIGDEISATGTATVRVVVRGPSWAPAQKLTLWSNSAIVGQVDIPPAQAAMFETSFAVPLTADCWFVAEVTGSQNMFPLVVPVEVPGLDASVLIKALSSGLDLSSLPLASTLKPDETHAVVPYAITSPIWVNVDGGAWSPPRAALPLAKPAPTDAPPPLRPAIPDVRDQFEKAGQLPQGGLP